METNKENKPETQVDIVQTEKKYLNIYDPAKVQETIANLPTAANMMSWLEARMKFAKHFDKEISETTPELRRAQIHSINLFNVLTGIRTMYEFKAVEAAGYNLGFKMLGTQEDYAQLIEEAAAIGIVVNPDMKALPAKTKDPDQKQFEFTEEDVTIENKELEKQLKKDAKAKTEMAAEQPEIDHTKLKKGDDEGLKKALHYYMSNADVFANAIKDTTDWYRNYLMYHKVKSDDTKEALDLVKAMSIGEVFGEILDLIAPTSVLSGIGSSMYINTKNKKSIIPAHCTLVKQAGAILNQQEIASIIKVIIEKRALWNITATKDDKSDVTDDAAVQTILDVPSTEVIDAIMAHETPENKELYFRIISTFYGKTKDMPQTEEFQTELNTNVRNIIGCIFNLYASSGNRLAEFDSLDPNNVIKAQKIETVEGFSTEETAADATA